MVDKGMPPQGGAPDPRERVRTPATMLMVTAGVGGLLSVTGLMMNLLGIGIGSLAGKESDKIVNILSGTLGIIGGVIGIGMAVLTLYGANQMKNLKSHGLAMAVSIIAMIPCISPCCLLGLPFGIWSLVVLSEAPVKAAFT